MEERRNCGVNKGEGFRKRENEKPLFPTDRACQLEDFLQRESEGEHIVIDRQFSERGGNYNEGEGGWDEGTKQKHDSRKEEKLRPSLSDDCVDWEGVLGMGGR